jgi:C-terminal processing protease CtpA/Prc
VKLNKKNTLRFKKYIALLKTNSLVLPAFAGLFFILGGCGINKAGFTPQKKYSPAQIQKDYSVYQSLLEEHHPGLYWYTSKDEMDGYFNWGRQQLGDSMTETQFRKILTYVTSKINCGHTTVRSSKQYSKFLDTARLGKMFPLSIKIWESEAPVGEEMMVVSANLNRRDSILKRGTPLTKINGRNADQLADTLFKFLSTDGYNRTHKFQTLSNRGFFGSMYTTVFGLSDKYEIEFRDTDGSLKNITITVYNPATDTIARQPLRRPVSTMPQPSRKQRRQQQVSAIRLLKIDSVNHTAMMDLGSFGRGYGLKRFFRRSFRVLDKTGIAHLIIDVRANGGGSVTNSTNISRYIATQKFKISDTLYAIRKKSLYSSYIQNHFWNRLFMRVFTRKRRDGFYHFGYFERHEFKPMKKHHFNGKVYILTGGNSFSATTLFINSIIKQDNVITVGEETGGGAYGNSAWLIPDVTLPETGIRFRLPLFRLVIDKNIPKDGRGVQPEVPSFPTADAIRKNADYKLDKAFELIEKDKEKRQ